MRMPGGRLTRGEVLERFRPTAGAAVGWAGLGMLGIVVAYCLIEVHSIVGVRVVLGCLVGAVLIWMTQFRPRVTAFDRGLLLHGSVRDTMVPYPSVDDVRMGQTLVVFSGGRRFRCVGIGQPLGREMRQRARSMGNSSQLGVNRSYDFATQAVETEPRPRELTYQDFVMLRISDLLAQHRDSRSDARPPVRHAPAVLELVALGVLVAALVVSLLL